MSKYSINDTTLTAIADAIREKGGTSAPILANGMAAAIAAIQAGGAGGGATSMITKVQEQFYLNITALWTGLYASNFGNTIDEIMR